MTTRFFTTIGLTLASAVLMTACSERSVKGTWSGSCQNVTFGGTAELEASFTLDDNVLSGYLSINGGELGGSGEIRGVVNGKSISFDTPGDNDMVTGIHWEGSISNKTITGTYLVSPTLKAGMLGAPVQRGEFTLRKN